MGEVTIWVRNRDIRQKNPYPGYLFDGTCWCWPEGSCEANKMCGQCFDFSIKDKEKK